MHTKKLVAGLAVLGSLLFTSLAFAQAGYVTLNSFSGPPAATLTVSGGGWASGDAIAIHLGDPNNTPAATATAGQDGTFSAQVTVPANAPQGPLAVYAVNGQGDQASNSYYVVPLTPSISVTAPGNTPFSTITVSGSGYAPGEQVLISLGSAATTATADQSGAFAGASLTIPELSSGLYLINAVGQGSGAKAVDYFWVNPFYPSAAPSAWYVQPGGSLSFSGTGFAPQERITVSAGGSVVASTTADQSGAFAGGSFIVPLSLRNTTAAFTVTGQQSGASVSIGVTVGDLYPYAHPSAWYLLPGSDVSFSGGGFGPGEVVNVLQSNVPAPVSHFTAGPDGTFTAAGTTTVPFDQGSSAGYRLVGTQSGVSTQTGISIGAFYPTISPSAYYSAPGGTIELSGSGFAPHETVNVRAGGESATTTADASGGWSLSGLALPYIGGATVALTATGAQSNATAQTAVTLGAFYPTVSPSTYYASPGRRITFSGAGFAPDEVVSVSGTSTTVTTDATGAFSGMVETIPFGQSGSMTITFTGMHSNAPASATITLAALQPWVTFSTYWAQGGSPLTISGGGFADGERITFSAGGTVFATTTADQSGAYRADTAVPFARPGSLTIAASGAESGLSVSANLTVAPVYTNLQLASYAGAPGTAVEFVGHGYLPNEPVVVTTDRTGSTPVATFTADATGSFDDSSYVIPGSFSAGNLVFIVTGVHSFDQKSITYYVAGS